ncbi:tryptophan 2,3-dioxygenase family protein [Paraflavitalea sp. CAU 1676]|uniref:tryptophan 2,3-dioxygenase n=1 Tax=Paraflavitalea sp. CAU 1676 TaxID=3032598 RepID=UPI0023DA8575|nr:tryptophan 2,3-dioxygenase family protein [Paraflavitalea sp. CAU 1676]MDF2187235.1 tryptophan 2,3-dioxygenase family protein [Paraflavitalea sp. CAU 1676]
MSEGVHYSDYLQLEKILDAQAPESDKLNQPAHDEMLFIIIHQAYELWFKQLLYEVDSVAAIMRKPAVNDNSPELQTVVHRLSRVVSILKVLVQQIDIMETMTPMDFLDFRDMLRPASGFQSWQFKILEAKLGLKYQHRFGQEYYISQLRPAQVELIKQVEQERSFIELLNDWLERMPFLDEVKDFWNNYRNLYTTSLASAEAENKAFFDTVFADEAAGGDRRLSPRACRAALFIMLYRGYPILQLPFQLLNNLLEIDEQLSTWRYRHMSMVHRMIGTRIGTGGSTGRDYLKGALDKHYIFAEIARLTSFLIERRKLPALPADMERRLGFVGGA